ncbi:hypothetical protein WAI453_013391 [Rhynchosporium graminicola]
MEVAARGASLHLCLALYSACRDAQTVSNLGTPIGLCQAYGRCKAQGIKNDFIEIKAPHSHMSYPSHEQDETRRA